MEGEAERLADILTALVVEEVVLQVIADCEPRAAGRVRRGVLAVRARNATSERSGSDGEGGSKRRDGKEFLGEHSKNESAGELVPIKAGNGNVRRYLPDENARVRLALYTQQRCLALAVLNQCIHRRVIKPGYWTTVRVSRLVRLQRPLECNLSRMRHTTTRFGPKRAVPSSGYETMRAGPRAKAEIAHFY